MHLFYKCTRFIVRKDKKRGRAAFMNEPFPPTTIFNSRVTFFVYFPVNCPMKRMAPVCLSVIV